MSKKSVRNKLKEISFVLRSGEFVEDKEAKTRILPAGSSWAEEESQVDMGDLDTHSFAQPVIWTTRNGIPVAIDRKTGLEVSPYKTINPMPKETALTDEEAKRIGGRHYPYRETKISRRYRQRPPSHFVPGTFRTKKISPTVSHVYGKMKKKYDGNWALQTIIKKKKPEKSEDIVQIDWDSGSGLQNVGYNNPYLEGTPGDYHSVPNLGRPFPYDPGQWETKNGVPYLVRKGKWERDYPYNPENIYTLDPISIQKRKDTEEKARHTFKFKLKEKSKQKLRFLLKDLNKGQEQQLIVEKITPQTPRMVAENTEESEKLIPSELPGGYLRTINGLPWLYDTYSNLPIHPLFNIEDSPKDFSYTSNKPYNYSTPTGYR
jgi:hypothetical protein